MVVWKGFANLYPTTVRQPMRFFAFLFIWLFFVGQTIEARDYDFKVLVNKGNNLYRNAPERDWGRIISGTSLVRGGQVKVVENAYLGLIHVTGNPLEVKTAGTYSIDYLMERLKEGNKGIGNHYTEFVLNTTEGVAGHEVGSRQHRGTADNVHLLLPEKGEIFGKELRLEWSVDPVHDNQDVIIKVYDLFNDLLYEQATNGKRKNISLDQPAFSGQQHLFIEVTLQADHKVKSSMHGIRRLSGEKQQEIQEKISLINRQAESPLNRMLLAFFFEYEGLLADALSIYLSQMEESSGEEFEEFYHQFVARNFPGDQ